MASATTYTHVGNGDNASHPTSPQGSSHGSSISPPSRYTPDLDSEDEEEPYILAGAEDGIGYEMTELNARGKVRDTETGHSSHGAGEDDELGSDDENGAWVDRTTSRRTSVQSFELYTPDEERAVRRKLDTHLVLFVAL
jgi:hypothetical protein